MKKFHPSSAGFMIADTVITKYDSGCLRSILVKANGVRTGEIPKVYQDVGAAHEDQHETQLMTDGAIAHVEREVPVKAQLHPEVEYTGRMDFKVFYHAFEDCVVHETKGTISKNTRRDVIRKGEYNVSYLAQLTSYMIRMRTHRGKLVCAYYEVDDTSGTRVWVKQEERVFKVTIEDSGRIDVDGEPSGFRVEDLLAHQASAVLALAKHEVAQQRPDKWNQKYGGPCTNCVFKRACDEFDARADMGTGEFIDACRSAVIAAQDTKRPDPEPFHVKIEKPVKEPKAKKAKTTKGGKTNG